MFLRQWTLQVIPERPVPLQDSLCVFPTTHVFITSILKFSVPVRKLPGVPAWYFKPLVHTLTSLSGLYTNHRNVDFHDVLNERHLFSDSNFCWTSFFLRLFSFFYSVEVQLLTNFVAFKFKIQHPVKPFLNKSYKNYFA